MPEAQIDTTHRRDGGFAASLEFGPEIRGETYMEKARAVDAALIRLRQRVLEELAKP